MGLPYDDLTDDRETRIEAGRQSFWFWFQYHFWWKSKKFTKLRAESLQSKNNTFIEAFRASRKTTLVRWFVCRCIAYKIHPSIIVQSYEDWLSAEWVREVAKMLFKKSVVEDHWYLFPVEKKGDLEKKSASNFESTTWVKVAAKSLWQTIRWANTFDMEEEMSARPTLLICDDIDVTKSVMNIEIINQNERKIMGETIGAMDPLNRKIIFLWNTINEDGLVPRFRNRYQHAETRDIFWQPLFDEKWVNVRPEEFTDDVVKQLKDDGVTAFNQNYLLIPSQSGNGVFIRRYFDYFLTSNFENPDSFLKKQDLRCWIFIDPAFSTSATSDDAVVIGMWEHNVSKQYYIIDWYADTSAPSKTIQAVIVMYNGMKASGFDPKFISVEEATISTRQTKFIEDMKAELLRHQITIPVYLYTSKVNKQIRIKDNLEWVMSMQWIKTNRDMVDKSFITKMETQFLEYPFGDHDDICDAISQGCEMFRKWKLWSDIEKPKPPQTYIDPRTGQRRVAWEHNLLSLNKLNHGWISNH